MKGVFAGLLGVVMVVFAGTAQAQDDNAKKIVGIWEVAKAGGDLPAGSTIEFTKDGKLNAVVKVEGMEVKLDGTYKVEKEKLTVKIKIGGPEHRGDGDHQEADRRCAGDRGQGQEGRRVQEEEVSVESFPRRPARFVRAFSFHSVPRFAHPG